MMYLSEIYASFLAILDLQLPIKLSHGVTFKCELQARDYLSMYQVCGAFFKSDRIKIMQAKPFTIRK